MTGMIRVAGGLSRVAGQDPLTCLRILTCPALSSTPVKQSLKQKERINKGICDIQLKDWIHKQTGYDINKKKKSTFPSCVYNV